MKTILIVDDDEVIIRLTKEAFKPEQAEIKVFSGSNGREAIKILNEVNIDLVLTDLKMPEMDGYELLSYMSKHHRNIPIIVMTGFGSPEIARRLKKKGVLSYIEKPFEVSELKEKIEQFITEKSKGYIHGFTLANFLQAVEVEQKTTTLKIHSQNRIGYLYLESGELIDAEDDEGLRGEEAAIAILCWDNAEIEIQGIHNRPRTIESSLMHILLEASKIKDEKGESSEKVSHEALLEEGIRFAEGHHFKEAHKTVIQYIKQQPRDYRGWLWYSRISVQISSIQSALDNALKLSPNAKMLIEERKKLKIAREQSGFSEKDQVRRCPFCWFPMEIKAVQCPYCKAHLFIHSTFFSSMGNANAEIMQQGIERYTRVIAREKNINAHYFLSIAHLNLENWEEALNLFHKTVKLSPEKEIFTEQLRALVNYMAMDVTNAGFDQELKNAKAGKNEPSDQDGSHEKKKILVVEDSSTTRKVIAITLIQKGYDIIEARDGLEALSRLNEEKPDLILLDIILPKMDGYKILSIIKTSAIFKDIPVIMLTSRDGFVNKVKGKMSGSAAYLTKPFDPNVLLETIQKHI